MATAHDDPESPPLPCPGRMTEEGFVEWCRTHEGVRAEWVGGEVVVMSPVNYDHLRLTEFLFRVMAELSEARDLGAVHGAEFINRFRAGDRLVRRLPDLWYVTTARLNLLRPTYLDGPPDLAVEVVSPDSVDRDYREKFHDYQAAGVREYWIIDPLSETVKVFRLEGEVYRPVAEAEGRVASEVLPGFSLRPEWLWQQPLPRVRDVLRDLGV